ncbi:hypothetical protein HDU89_000950 [Geranomyces variabilis]|nr:hypothetical protein HDU89_000950 [Geranomyces variabilis]
MASSSATSSLVASAGARRSVWPSAASLLLLFVALFLVSTTTTDNGAHALAIPARLPVPAASVALASLSSTDPAIAFADLPIRDDSDSRKRKREQDSEAKDSEGDIDSTVSDMDLSDASSLPDDESSDNDWTPGGKVPTENPIGVYEQGVDLFLHPTNMDAKKYSKNWDGYTYKTVGDKYLRSRPGLKITGPADATGKIIQWNYDDIKDTNEVDFEHLVEGHDVAEVVKVLRGFRKGLTAAKREAFRKLKAKNVKLTFKITLDGKTTEKEFTGTFARLLGEALNGVGNGGLLINSINNLKFLVANGAQGISEGQVGFAGLIAYLTEFEEKIGNSAENIISVFEGIRNAINNDPAVADAGFSARFGGHYGKGANGAPNKLLALAKKRALQRVGKPLSASLKEVVAALNKKTAPAPGPQPKPLTTSAAASAKACGSSFARGFERSPVAHLAKRAFGCDSGVLVDENGEAVDQFGNNFNDEDQPVNEDGDLVDENNNAIDKFGNKLDENGEPRNAQGQRIDSEGNVDADQSPRQPSLRCSGGSASACRSKQRTLRKKQKPGSKDNARGIEDDEAEIYSEPKGDIDRDTVSTLANMKTITGDGNILPNGDQGFDVDNPKFIFNGAETLDAAWESVGKSFESAISSMRKRMVNRSAIKKTLRSWRRNIAQRIQRETLQPRAERDGLKVSENERQASVSNSALDNYNVHEPNDPVLAVYNLDNSAPVALEAFPDSLGDSIRNSDETASRAGLDVLREFSDLTDGAILPKGAEGLTLTVDGTSAMDDAIDPSEGIIAGAGEGSSPPIESWDQA